MKELAVRASAWQLLALLMIVGSPSGASHAQWNQNGKPVPDEPWRRSVGTFGAMLLLTADEKQFFEQWDQPARPGYTPNLKPTQSAVRGEKVTAVVFFVGCKADPGGNCSLRADFKVTRPDGG